MRRPGLLRLLFFAVCCLTLGQPAAAQTATVVLKGNPLSRLLRGVPDTTSIARAGDSARVLGGAPDSLVLSARQYYAFTLPDTVRAALATHGPEEHFETPVRLLSLNSAGRPRLLALSFGVDGGGIRYDPGADRFRGTLRLWLEDADSGAAEYRLAQPVTVGVFAQADSVIPDAVMLNHTGSPFERLTLMAMSVEDTVEVSFRAGEGLTPTAARVPVLPAVRVRSSPVRIQGWGIQTATIRLQLVGHPPRPTYRVSVLPARGVVEPDEVTLRPDSSASAVLRSRGLGPDSVFVSTPGLQGAFVVVRYTAPIGFAVAVVLGGLCGGMLREFRNRRRRGAVSGRRFARAGVIGVLTGLVAAVGYALGVRVFSVGIHPAFGEAGVFLVAAYAATIQWRPPEGGPAAAPAGG